MLNTLVPPPPQVFLDQFPILGSGMNSNLILPTSPNNVLGVEGERLISHYPTNSNSLILPTSPNIIHNVLDSQICPLDERLISHYPMDSSIPMLPTSPNNFIYGVDDQNQFDHSDERLISHYLTIDDSSTFVLPTSPNNEDDQLSPPDERLKNSHYLMDCSTGILLPTSPNNSLLDGGEDNRFCPSDERLISHYLIQKMLGNEDQVTQIPEIDILNHEPWDLLPTANGEQCYKEAYYFCRRRSYFTSKDRYKRTTGDGYWKPTGKHRPVRRGANGEVIGSKRSLVFHYGRSAGQSTGYTMHEYSASSIDQPGRDLVLCKVMKKGNKTKTGTKRSNKKAKTEEEAAGSCQMASGFGNQNRPTRNDDGEGTKEISTFPQVELDACDSFQLPDFDFDFGLNFDFDFDFGVSSQQQQQQLVLREPEVVQQFG